MAPAIVHGFDILPGIARRRGLVDWPLQRFADALLAVGQSRHCVETAAAVQNLIWLSVACLKQHDRVNQVIGSDIGGEIFELLGRHWPEAFARGMHPN